MGIQEQRDAVQIEKLEAERKKLYAEIDRVKQGIQRAEAEAEAAAKTAAARETAASMYHVMSRRDTNLLSVLFYANYSFVFVVIDQARLNAQNAAGMNQPRASAINPADIALAIGGEGVPVDAGAGVSAHTVTTAQGTTRTEFGPAAIRRVRDVSG
jgi:hypothetical protein